MEGGDHVSPHSGNLPKAQKVFSLFNPGVRVSMNVLVHPRPFTQLTLFITTRRTQRHPALAKTHPLKHPHPPHPHPHRHPQSAPHAIAQQRTSPSNIPLRPSTSQTLTTAATLNNNIHTTLSNNKHTQHRNPKDSASRPLQSLVPRPHQPHRRISNPSRSMSRGHLAHQISRLTPFLPK